MTDTHNRPDAADVNELASELRRDIHRWLRELEGGASVRFSIWAGNATRASNKVETILRHTIAHLVDAGEPKAISRFQGVARGRPLERLTMGEYVKVLERMNHDSSLHGFKLSKSDLRKLNRLPKLRAQIQHPVDEVDIHEEILEFLRLCRWLSTSPLVQRAENSG